MCLEQFLDGYIKKYTQSNIILKSLKILKIYYIEIKKTVKQKKLKKRRE